MTDTELTSRIELYWSAYTTGKITALELEGFLQALQRMCRPQLRLIQGGRA